MKFNAKKLANIGLTIGGMLFPVVSQVEALAQMVKDKDTPWSSQQKEDEAVQRLLALLGLTEAEVGELANDAEFQTLCRNAIRSIVAVMNAVKSAKHLRTPEAA